MGKTAIQMEKRFRDNSPFVFSDEYDSTYSWVTVSLCLGTQTSLQNGPFCVFAAKECPANSRWQDKGQFFFGADKSNEDSPFGKGKDINFDYRYEEGRVCCQTPPQAVVGIPPGVDIPKPVGESGFSFRFLLSRFR